MKRILAIAALMFAATGAAQAQTHTLGSQIRLGNNYTINLKPVQYISLKPGKQYVIDRQGRTTPITLTNRSQATSAAAFVEFFHVGDDVWANLGEAHRVYCDQNSTVMEWIYVPREVRQDGCALASAIDYGSRRN